MAVQLFREDGGMIDGLPMGKQQMLTDIIILPSIEIAIFLQSRLDDWIG